MHAKSGGEGAWEPLRIGMFRAIWLANISSNMGTAIQNVAAAWLMLSISTQPEMVAYVQTTTALSMVLFAVAGGVIADS